MIFFAAAVIGKLFFLQIKNGDFYKALSQGLHASFAETEGERGEIFLSDGKPLAVNIDYPFLYVVPKGIEDAEKTSEALSEVLGLDKNFISEKINQDNFYSVVKKKLTSEEVEAVQKLNLEGVHLDKETGRYYPQETLASQVVGFLGAEGNGQYGVEESFDEVLKGEQEFTGTQKGSDLFLTLDYNVQFEAEKLLEKAKENLKIEKGLIIVADPNSGKIIAMASSPVFNPNTYQEYASKEGFSAFKETATQELFEPGSVFKPITMAGALEEGKITPDTTYVDKGSVKIEGWPKPIYNYDQKVYGEQTMTNVLEKSINTGAVFAEKALGKNLFLKYIEKFGFFQPTGIELQETYSENNEVKTGREINLATAAFGQGIEMTPIQLIRAFSAIANGGKLVKPYIIEKKVQGGVEIKTNPELSDLVISSKTARQVTSMMISVVENGFGKSARIPQYYIAGKTGTAQVTFSALGIDKEGYSQNTIQTFISFFPAFNPKFLVLVKLDNPQAKTAEYSAVPIFHDLADYMIHYYQIPPDYE